LLRDIAANPEAPVSKLGLAPVGQSWNFPVAAKKPRSQTVPSAATRLGSANAPETESRNLQPDRPSSANSGMTKVQTDLAAIWSEVLGAPEVGPNDNLFDLGGHSLLITRIISRIRKAFGVELPIYVFFETPTLGGIATAIEEALATGDSEASKPGLRELAGR
jgi:acyl carrier protein